MTLLIQLLLLLLQRRFSPGLLRGTLRDHRTHRIRKRRELSRYILQLLLLFQRHRCLTGSPGRATAAATGCGNHKTPPLFLLTVNATCTGLKVSVTENQSVQPPHPYYIPVCTVL